MVALMSIPVARFTDVHRRVAILTFLAYVTLC